MSAFPPAKKTDLQNMRRTLSLPVIQTEDQETYNQFINDSLTEIENFLNQLNILYMAEVGSMIKNPENGMLLYASGWTKIQDVNPD